MVSAYSDNLHQPSLDNRLIQKGLKAIKFDVRCDGCLQRIIVRLLYIYNRNYYTSLAKSA